MWFEKLGVNRYEHTIANACELPRDVRSLLAGTSRAVRLSVDDDVCAQRTVQNVAAGVIAPLALLYTWWLLRDAQAKGMKRLYFLARDGHILFKVAKVLVDKWGLDIDLRYLYCSRESLLLPSFQNITSFERYWITWGYLSTITLGEICQRLNLEEEDVSAFFTVENNFPDLVTPLDRKTLEQVMLTLGLPEVRMAVQARNRKLYDDTIGYLRQEGLFDSVPYALVDTGWKGTSQYALSSILDNAEGGHNVHLSGYYLGLNDEVFVYKKDKLKPFLFDWTQTARDYRLYNFLCFEMLFATKHGRTKRYIEVGGVWRPEFHENPDVGCHWQIDVHHEATQKYVHHVTRLLNLEDFPEGAARLCRQLMRLFISSPTMDEALVYGDNLIASEIREGDMQKIAPEMTLGGFGDIVVGRARIKGYWPQASFVRSGLHIVNRGYGLFLDLKLLDIYRKYFLKY